MRRIEVKKPPPVTTNIKISSPPKDSAPPQQQDDGYDDDNGYDDYDGGQPAVDESLNDLMNPDKVFDGEPPPPSSPVREAGARVQQYFQDHDDQGTPPVQQQQIMPPAFVRPAALTDEERLRNSIRKAKLLARLEQLADRGLKIDLAKYTFETSLSELECAVAKYEIIALRGARIEQGRAILLTFTNGVEKGLTYVDNNEMIGKDFKFRVDGWSNHVTHSIETYDDILERGMEELLGSPEKQKWYVALALQLGSSLVMYSLTNRQNYNTMKEDLRREVKEDLLREFRQSPPPAPKPPSPPPITGTLMPTPVVGKMRPPPSSPAPSDDGVKIEFASDAGENVD
jgi:hypothetical protein